eukprot:7007623-Prymnesium_polylepis.1
MFERATDAVLGRSRQVRRRAARHASHVLASLIGIAWPAWRRAGLLLRAGAALRRQNWRASPNGCPRGRCAPT